MVSSTSVIFYQNSWQQPVADYFKSMIVCCSVIEAAVLFIPFKGIKIPYFCYSFSSAGFIVGSAKTCTFEKYKVYFPLIYSQI